MSFELVGPGRKAYMPFVLEYYQMYWKNVLECTGILMSGSVGHPVLAKPVSDIINLWIKLSTFPDKYQLAKSIPLFKTGCKTDLKNYRLISLLLLLSKLIEKAIQMQTQEYLAIYYIHIYIPLAYVINFKQVLGKLFPVSPDFFNKVIS